MLWIQNTIVTSRINYLLKRLINRHSGPRLQSLVTTAGDARSTSAPPPVCRLTVEQAVSLWGQHFKLGGVTEPRLSSRYIIAHVLGVKTLETLERGRLAEFLSHSQTERVWELCTKRLTRMPVQYVIEEWDFRDLTLKMRPPVFIPRPETEELVSLVLADLQMNRATGEGEAPSLRCLEVGCGSGAISLSLLHSVPQLRAVAVDQSQKAVCLTRENACRLGLHDRLEVHQLDVVKDADMIVTKCRPVHVLVSNPPYLFTEDMGSLEPEILRFEDHAALDGGADGMYVIGRILALASQLLSEQGRVYLEVDPRHPPLIQCWVEERMVGLEFVETHHDITDRPRFCILQRSN